jgi:hypothetical protein
MPYQGDVAAANPGGAVGVTRTAQAPLDLGGGAGGLPVTSQTSVAGESGMRGATIPVDGLQQASTSIERGKADPAATNGAEGRLDALNGVGGPQALTSDATINDLPERDPRA